MNGYVEGYLVYSDVTKTTLVACSSAATENITIPNSVTSIGGSAVSNVPNIIYFGIYFGTTTGAPWGARSMNGYLEEYLVYSDSTKTTLLACSSAAKGAISISNSVTSIGYGAFCGCSGLTSIIISNYWCPIKILSGST